MIIFMIIAFILLFIFLDNKNNKFNALLMSISFTFFYLYIITEIVSLISAISQRTIIISWIIYDLVLIILNVIKFHKNGFNIKIDIKQILEKLSFIRLITIIIMIYLIILSIKTVPYNWDSMTYHLPRIMHWIQNGSINHYSTNIIRQITSPSFAEISNMHVYLLSGENDIYLNILQAVSFVLNACIVYFISKKIGCDKKFSIIAMILALSMPIAFAEALSTQVDNFAALWCLIFTYFIIDFLNKRENLKIDKINILKVICLAIALGLGYLTKPTVLFSDALFLGFLIIICVIRKDKFLNVLKLSLIACIITCIIIGPNIARNIKTFNAISDPIAGSKQMIHTDKINYFYINFIKNLLWNYPTFIIEKNSTNITDYVKELAQKYDVEIDDESISEGGKPYQVSKGMRYEQDYAFNPLIMWLLTISIILYIIYIVKNRFKNVWKINSYCIISILSFLIFISIMRFQIWGTRYEISFLLLLCSIVGVMLNKVLDKSIYKDYVIGAIICIALISIYNQFIYHNEKTINNDNRIRKYFTSNPVIYDTYSEITDIINKNNYSNIGIEVTEDTYEYPFYIMIKNLNRLEHVNVNNRTSMYADNKYIPDIVISNISKEDNKTYNEHEYIKCYDKDDYSVYEIIK